jgi:hypothetical protein
MGKPEEADKQYWAEQELFTAWEAAFLFCNLEPFEEPFELTSVLPRSVKTTRIKILSGVPNCKDGTSIPSHGWSCRNSRPVSTNGKIFRREDLLRWAISQQQELPTFLAE